MSDHKTNALLERILHILERDEKVDEHILHELRKHCRRPRLTAIQLLFTKGTTMSAPVTLTAVGQTTTATVLGFDQFGNPWTGAIPPTTFTSDDTQSAVITFDPATGVATDVANGTANITATLTTAEGKALSDTESIIVVDPENKPVLTAIKVDFSTPTP